MVRLYNSAGSWPIEDGLLQLSFVILAVSLLLQCIAMLYANMIQVSSRYQSWAEVRFISLQRLPTRQFKMCHSARVPINWWLSDF